ncbi:membrane protein of ER body 2-like isoform X2 [Papaver somniferum]|uniref:membrane protein of ER body 2-like isoform X2 n=1 Tax=Papaver somniferum TaxID=3469 RepID=UPI000E6F5A73|nr:membrane protein of ER body 2-like isoform X2 [Papaver somniferum]
MESCSSKTKIDQHIQNPKGHFHRTTDMETLSRQEYCFDLERKAAVSTSNGTNRTNEIGSPSAEHSTAGNAPTKDELEVEVSSPNAEKSLVNGTNLHETLINEVEQTGFHVERPVENGYSNVKLVGNKHVQFGEVEVSNTEEEVIEWDVERVIEEQETHDLICPNCKACITKRVILRKRKRSVPITEDTRETKKFGTPTRSILKTDPSTSSSNSQGHYAGAIPGAPDTNERRNDVFRCFSCFSFFIPTVAGFRLFRCFGFDDEESLPNSQPTPSPNQGTRLPKEVKLVGEVTPDGKRTADSDDKNESIPSLSTTFPFLEPAHGNDQVKDAIGKIEVEEQNVIVSPLQGTTTMEEIQRDTTENPKSSRKEIDGGKYSNTPKEVDDKGILTLSENDALLLRDRRDGIGGAEHVPIKNIAGGDVILDIVDAPKGSGYSPSVQLNIVPAAPLVPLARGTESLANEQGSVTATRSREWDILKSIVYGGLVEAIMSLGVVSSAAGADATTLNIVALGMASLVSGLLVIIHGLGELKSDQHERVTEVEDEKVDRYEELLGRRRNFRRHAIVVVLSYLVFGLLPPIIYGFSFRNSNNKDYKMLSVAAVSLICIILLAIGKAHTHRPPWSNSSYIKTTLYFVSIGLATSGLSFVLGEVVKKLLEKFALLEPNASFSPSPPSSSFLLGQTIPSIAESSAWASY